jgi:hypothetical protein
MRLPRLPGLALCVVVVVLAACKFDSAYRDVPDPTLTPCTEGVVECTGSALVRCDGGKRVTLDDCGARSLVCAPGLLKCTACLPQNATCDGFDVIRCGDDGQTKTKVQTCGTGDDGIACRSGVCTNLCVEATVEHSNVGCEYWAVDLDNAVTSQGNAAAQQYAVVVSNAQPDVVATVTVDEDFIDQGRHPAGTPEIHRTRTISTARIGPHSLEVFKLGPKEVDGSPPGTFNTGTNTALSWNAFRVRSDVPIVAFQFNPLENVNVFSNDASLLLPTPALGGGGGRQYVIAGWPQTIATTENPATNFGTDLRAFLTIVGTQADTHVHVMTTAAIVPGGPLTNGVPAGGAFDITLQPFEVMNLETGGFNADFTGSLVDSTGPVAVYVGSEASDAPFYATLATRSCCADHLEAQVFPVRSAGKRFAIGRVPNRSRALIAAGAAVSLFDEPEFYRIVASRTGTTKVTTTLPVPDDAFELDGEGANRTITAHQDFTLTSSQPVLIADVQASQEAAGIVRGLPGGDPSLSYVTAIEQWRNDYILLTPDKYAFDFLIITAPFGAQVFLDGLPIDGTVCELGAGDGLDAKSRKAADPPFSVYRCQLSFPAIDPNLPTPQNVLPGRQNDGVHRVQSDYPVGVLVYGFDAFVSYAYAGGTELKDINPN